MSDERHRETPTGVVVERRIALGMTEFFEDEEEARAHASKVRSYHYPCREFDKELGCEVTTGFCVPK